MKALLCLLLLSATMTPELIPAPKLAADGPDHSGVWLIHGEDRGNPYRETATIWRAGDLYVVHYSTTTDGEKGPVFTHMAGTGVYNDGSLAVTWGEGKLTGVTCYRVSGKTLVGRWVMLPSDGKARTETLTLMGKVRQLE